MKKDENQLHLQGQRILNRLSAAIHEVQHLEAICIGHQAAIAHCEQTLESVAVDIASITTGGGEWDEMSSLLHKAGIPIPADLDRDMRSLVAGNDSCLE